MIRLALVACCVLFALVQADSQKDDEKRFRKCNDISEDIYKYEVETLHGDKISLKKFKGKVLLIINVATFCGYTEQYLDFNGLMSRNSGVQLLAFPCNQFQMQEPGNNSEILNGLKYVRPGNNWIPNDDVHILGKLEVNGAAEHPLYTFLKNNCPGTTETIGKRATLFYDPVKTSDVTWNFEKFVIDKRGRPRYRFHPAAWQKGKMVEEYLQTLSAEL